MRFTSTGSIAEILLAVQRDNLGIDYLDKRNSMLDTLAKIPGVANAWVKVTKTAGNNPFVVYGVINDGGTPGVRSDDGACVAMEVDGN